MLYTSMLKVSACAVLLAYVDVVMEMNYLHRLMAMGLGGIAALFAIFFAEPKTKREANDRPVDHRRSNAERKAPWQSGRRIGCSG